MTKPRFTIVTPVYNRPRLLQRALRSLVRQSYEDFECLIVDDASAHGPDDVVAELSDQRFRIIRRDRNGGPVAARLSAFREARGAFLVALDSDNEFYPWALSRAATLFDSHPEAGCVTGLYVFPDGLRMRVSNGARLVGPAEYRAVSAKGTFDCVGMVRRGIVNEWLERRTDYYGLEFHQVFWMALHHSQLFVDEPWGVYHTDAAGVRVSERRDARDYADIVRFVEEYRPLVGTDPCVPLDEYLARAWFTLRRAGRRAELEVVRSWMNARGLSEKDALRDALVHRLRQRITPRSVKVI